MQAENEAEIAEQLRVKDETGRVVIEIGLLATLYFERTWAPDVRAAVAACAEASWPDVATASAGPKTRRR